MGLAASAPVASVATARELTQALLLDPKGALDALPCLGCVVWAPPDQSCLGRLLAGFTQHAAEHPSPKSLRLLVPVESFPGCFGSWRTFRAMPSYWRGTGALSSGP